MECNSGAKTKLWFHSTFSVSAYRSRADGAAEVQRHESSSAQVRKGQIDPTENTEKADYVFVAVQAGWFGDHEQNNSI